MNDLGIGFARQDLLTLERNLNRIAGEWNGDEPGAGEERASLALEAIDKIHELKETLDQL